MLKKMKEGNSFDPTSYRAVINDIKRERYENMSVGSHSIGNTDSYMINSLLWVIESIDIEITWAIERN